MAFVIDAYARRILGRRAATAMATPLALDALEQAIWTRGRTEVTDLTGLVDHTDAGSQYTSIAFTVRLQDAGVDASVGSVGDAYDNALAESTIGLFKNELIHRQDPWRGRDQVELATPDWVDWYNHRRPHGALPIYPQPTSKPSTIPTRPASPRRLPTEVAATKPGAVQRGT